MSIDGLYDSLIGDKLARQTLKHEVKSAPVIPERKRQRCACGNYVNKVPKYRHGVKVCDICAALTSPLHGGQPLKNKCCLCNTKTPRRNLVVRNGRLFCKACIK